MGINVGCTQEDLEKEIAAAVVLQTKLLPGKTVTVYMWADYGLFKIRQD